jgi:hypothetical protein
MLRPRDASNFKYERMTLALRFSFGGVFTNDLYLVV